MTLPLVAAKTFAMVDLETGTEYWWCACGRSKSQPFCDGSHEGTGITPKSFTVDKSKGYALCQCKQTGKAPFCDGTHRKL